MKQALKTWVLVCEGLPAHLYGLRWRDLVRGSGLNRPIATALAAPDHDHDATIAFVRVEGSTRSDAADRLALVLMVTWDLLADGPGTIIDCDPATPTRVPRISAMSAIPAGAASSDIATAHERLAHKLREYLQEDEVDVG